MLERLRSNKRHLFIVGIWLLAAVLAVVNISYLGKPFKLGDVTDPQAESTQARKIMENVLPYGGSSVIVLYKSEHHNVNDPVVAEQIKKSLSRVNKLSFAHRVSSPFENTEQISDNQQTAYAVIKTDTTAELLANQMGSIRHALGQPKNIEMIVGGEPAYISDVYKLSEKNLIRGELIALPICFILMILVFGGFSAALTTMVTGVISITIIETILYMLATQMNLTVFVLNIATILGLSLSLDYALLITYRFREESLKTPHCTEAMQTVLRTAGTSIMFSGLIVLISMTSLIFFPINVLFSLGVAGIVVVLVTVSCSLTFLPACLCLFEKRVTSTIPRLKKISTENIHNHRWFTFAMLVMRHPLLVAIPTIAILLMLGYPFINVKLNNSDASILPKSVESWKLQDQFNKYFNKEELSPIDIVFKSKNNSILTKDNIGQLYDYAKNLKKDKRVDKIISIVTIKPELNKAQYQTMYTSSELPFDETQKNHFKESTKGRYTVMNVISKYPRNDQRNFDLVNKIRHDQISHGITKQVTGSSAEIIDAINIMYKLFFKLLIIISIVTYFTLLVLLRSLILPLKAILMNFLSLSVCYGMLVFIFQEGHFQQLLHFKSVGYTDMTLPILLFFSLFGLSMDYEVFLLTRIKEFYEISHDNEKAVAMGLERSARIITSAALIVVIVAGAFVSADLIIIKSFGLGAALAIAIDATLIRLLLVPATMRLMGDWNWYLPKWLNRLLPNIHFDK